MNDSELPEDVALVNAFLALVERLDRNNVEAGKMVGVTHTTVGRWKRGFRQPKGWKEIQAPTRRRIRAVLDSPENANENDSDQEAGSMEGQPTSALEWQWWEEYKRIRASDASSEQKMIEIDQLGSFVARIAWAIGEDAARARARAVLSNGDRDRGEPGPPTVEAAPVEPPVRTRDSTGTVSGGMST